MAISYVNAASAQSSSVNLPSGWSPGDLAIVIAWNTGTGLPTVPSGWRQITSYTDVVGAIRVLQSGDTSTGTFTNATRIGVAIYSGQNKFEPIDSTTAGGGVSYQIKTLDTSLTSQVMTVGYSNSIGVVLGITQDAATNIYDNALSGYTNRSSGIATTDFAVWDKTGDTTSTSTGFSAASQWATLSVGIRAENSFPFIADQDTKSGTVTSNSTSWTLTYPTNIAEGDLLLAFVATDGTQSSQTWPSGWISASPTYPSGAVCLLVSKKIATGSESGNFTLTLASSEQGSWMIYRIPNSTWYGTLGTSFDNTNTSDGMVNIIRETSVTNNPGTNPNPPSINPYNWDAENTLWIATMAADTSRTVSAYPSSPDTFTNTGYSASGGSNGATLAWGRLEKNASSVDPGTFTISTSDDWSAVTVAVRPRQYFSVVAQAQVAIKGLSGTANFSITLNSVAASVSDGPGYGTGYSGVGQSHATVGGYNYYEAFLTVPNPSSIILSPANIVAATLYIFANTDTTDVDSTLNAGMYDFGATVDVNDFRSKAQLGALVPLASYDSSTNAWTGAVALTNIGDLAGNISETSDSKLILWWQRHEDGVGPSTNTTEVLNYVSSKSYITLTWALQSYGQAQAKIATGGAVTTRVYAQSNSDIKATSLAPAQAQTDIKTTYRGYAQALARIKQTYPQGSSFSSIIVADSPIGYWNLDETEGTNANDLGSMNHDGTYTNCTLGQTGLISTGYSTYLSGTNSYVKIINQTYDFSNDTFAIEAWIKTDSPSGTGSVFNMSGGTGGMPAIKIDSNGTLRAVANGAQNIMVSSAGYISSGTAYHIVWVKNGTSNLMYINGTDHSADFTITDYNFSANGSGDTFIGINADGSSEPFKGWIDEVAIYPSILTGSQVSAHYSAGISGGIQGGTFAQAQAKIIAGNKVYAQSQSQIKTFAVNSYAQAQSQTKQTYQVWAQGQGQIKTTYRGYAQAQNQIKTTYRGHAQAQALIKTYYQVYAQAQGLIKQTYRIWAQANAQIILSNLQGYAQGQVLIKTTYKGYSQANAQIILSSLTVYAQSQANIKQSYISCAQSQAQIKQIYQSYAQAQSQIRITYCVYAQSLGQIKATTQVWAQSNSQVKSKGIAYAQAPAWIKQTYPFGGGGGVTLAQDSFTEAGTGYIQLSAHTAETGGTWTQNGSGTETLRVNRDLDKAQKTSGATSDAWALLPTDAGDADLYLTQGYSAGLYDQPAYLAARSDGSVTTLNLYAFGFNFSFDDQQVYWYLNRITAGVSTTIGSGAPAQSGSETLRGRFHVEGVSPTILKGKFWLASGAEPGTWTIDTTDNTAGNQTATGKVGIGQHDVSGTNGGIDDFLVVSSGEPIQGPTFAQAQAKIGAISLVYAQSQSQIKATTQGYGQAQGQIKVTYQVYAQANAQITVGMTTVNVYAQALTSIKQTYQAYAQSQAQIKQTYQGYAQALPIIKTSYLSCAQVLALVKASSLVYGQSQAQIKQSYDVYANTLTQIKRSYSVYAQSQGQIKTIYYVYAQAQTQIKATSLAYSNTQGRIKQTYLSHANALAQIKTYYQGYAQSNAYLKITEIIVVAQAQSQIKYTYKSYGQSQARIYAFNIQAYAQSLAFLTGLGVAFAQAQAQIKTTYIGYAQVNAQVKQTYQVYAQALGQIKTTYREYGQSLANIKQTYQAYAQALSQVKTTYKEYGQAQSQIKVTANYVCAQSMAQIKTTYQVYAQSQAQIKQAYQAYAQSLGQIKQAYQAYAQTQANLISKVSNYAQALAQIYIPVYLYPISDITTNGWVGVII